MTVNGREFQTMVPIIREVRISEGQIIRAILYWLTLNIRRGKNSLVSFSSRCNRIDFRLDACRDTERASGALVMESGRDGIV